MEYNMNELQRSYMLGVQRFTYDRSNYLKKNGYQVDRETRRQIWDDYEICIKEAIEHLRKLFPNGFIQTEGTIDFTLEGMPEDARSFLNSPAINCTIKPAGEDCSAIMSFEDGKLVESIGAEDIPGLPRRYKTERLNEILEGRSIIEIKILFDELGVLPKNNLIDMVIEEYKMRGLERRQFIRMVVNKLLLANNSEDLARAYLFDYFMGSNFNFDEYKANKRTK